MCYIQIDEGDDDGKSEDAHAAIDQLCPEQPGFVGVDQLIHHLVDMSNQLLCRDTQVLAGSENKAFCSLFEVFQKKLHQVVLSVKCKQLKNMQQMTLHDCMQTKLLLNQVVNYYFCYLTRKTNDPDCNVVKSRMLLI